MILGDPAEEVMCPISFDPDPADTFLPQLGLHKVL